MTAGSPAVSSAGDRRRWWALLVIALGQLMVVFDVTIVNVALPSIGRSLDISTADRHWVITAYTVAFAGLLLVGGRVADRVGRKRSFLIALAGFAVASAVGGAAVNLPMLVAARAGQGVFGALLAPTALSLVATTFPDPGERGRAFAVFGVVMGGGAGVGLVLGGVLTEYLSWQWVMYVNTPLALAAAAGATVVLTDSHSREGPRVDVVGAVLATAGLAALVLGFSATATHGWTAPLTVGMLAAGMVLLLAFVAVQARLPHPLLPLRILVHRSRGGGYLAFAVVMVGMFGMFLLVSFYLQTVAGYTALQAGLAFLPFAGAVLASSTMVGRVMTRLRSGLLLAGGLALAAAGMAWLTQLRVDSSYPGLVLPAVLLIGLGLGLMSPVAANLATVEVPDRDSGVASAVFNASEQVGASIGLAVLNTVAATSTGAYLAANQRHRDVHLAGLVHGYTVAAAWAAAILAIAAIVTLVLVNARLDSQPEPAAVASSRRDAPARQRPPAGPGHRMPVGESRPLPHRVRQPARPSRPATCPQSTTALQL
jgi:EmrB/QacA subfamily drug resistance transporter